MLPASKRQDVSLRAATRKEVGRDSWVHARIGLSRCVAVLCVFPKAQTQQHWHLAACALSALSWILRSLPATSMRHRTATPANAQLPATPAGNPVAYIPAYTRLHTHTVRSGTVPVRGTLIMLGLA